MGCAPAGPGLGGSGGRAVGAFTGVVSKRLSAPSLAIEKLEIDFESVFTTNRSGRSIVEGVVSERVIGTTRPEKLVMLRFADFLGRVIGQKQCHPDQPDRNEREQGEEQQ
jgi:hypothetical protein